MKYSNLPELFHLIGNDKPYAMFLIFHFHRSKITFASVNQLHLQQPSCMMTPVNNTVHGISHAVHLVSLRSSHALYQILVKYNISISATINVHLPSLLAKDVGEVSSYSNCCCRCCCCFCFVFVFVVAVVVIVAVVVVVVVVPDK